MKNPFSIDSEPRSSLPRNAVPLSYQNLFTTEFGRITPVFCKEVLPDDTFQIDGSIAIQGMPTVFPVQTRIRASLSFFYSRNRNVFDDFEDFIFKTKEVEAPWLKLDNQRAKQMISTNSLGDFFNISTTKARYANLTIPVSQNGSHPFFGLNSAASNALLSEPSDGFVSAENLQEYFIKYYVNVSYSGIQTYVYRFPLDSLSKGKIRFRFVPLSGVLIPSNGLVVGIIDSNGKRFAFPLKYEALRERSEFSFDLPFDISLNANDENLFIVSRQNQNSQAVSFNFIDTTQSFQLVEGLEDVVDATDDSVISENIYIGDNPQDRLDVWKFRHYEMICNYYYRDDRNNPYYLNGEPQYNEFIPTHAGGADENIYDFHYAPWEKDPFTTAVQSPQFGDAPLVGITINSDGSSADLVFNKDGGTAVDGTTTENFPKIRVHIDDEGYIDGIGDFSDDVPSASLRKLINGIQSKQGISINDFRVTNSFQRFLENTLRRGLRYRNQLKSHFGVSVDYPDIDVPEYIGGVSTELNVSRVTNTADSPNAGLGDFVGQLSGLLQMKHKITRYIHEHGFIMGLLTITPIPTYSQITSKDNLKLHPFDFYQTEFGKIGYVPIHYNELSPMQTEIGQSIDDVFGYQKAWYDYMFSFDEVHGDFRTTLKDFVLSRTFAERPTLVEDFVRVKPEHLNHIFVTENIADAYGSSAKFMCNAFFTVSAKRPIPVRGIPSLE